jgi:hypothetical protein
VYDARENLMGKGKGWMDVWRKFELADEDCVALKGEAFAEAVVSCEVNRQWRKGTNPVAASHMRMVMPSPQENPHTIKSDAVYPMEVSLVDVMLSIQRGYAFLFWTSYALSIVLRKPGCAERGWRMCELGDLYALAGERVVSDMKEIGRRRAESRREEGRGEETGKEESFGERKVKTKMDGGKRGFGKTPYHTTRFVEATQIPHSPIAEKPEITHLSLHFKPSKPHRMIELDRLQPKEQQYTLI